MKKYECHTIINGKYSRFVREFESFEHAYAVLESEGHKVFSLKENMDYIYEQATTACTYCANNPKNGGSGVCNCILGTHIIT